MIQRLNSESLNNLLIYVTKFLESEIFTDIVEPYESVLARYQPVFSSDSVGRISEEIFRSFLKFTNNKHWTGLTRTAPRMCADMDNLHDALTVLVDESLPIAERYDYAINQVDGMGSNIATAILIISQPNKYSVWNSRSEKNLKQLGMWPTFERGESLGNRYEKINESIHFLKDKLELDLWTIDAFWYFLDKQSEPSEMLITDLALLTNGLESWYQNLRTALLEHGATWIQQTKPIKPKYLQDFIRQITDKGYFQVYGYAQSPVKAIAHLFKATKIETSNNRTSPPDDTVPSFDDYDVTQGKCRDEDDYKYFTWVKVEHIENVDDKQLDDFIVHTTKNKVTTSGLRGMPHLYVVPKSTYYNLILNQPLVLIENERTATGDYDDWMDVTGERYHFLNQYKNKILSGRPFVYCRGVRRVAGREQMEYFGRGSIGTVYEDLSLPPNTQSQNIKWFADIEDYVPFVSPVPGKTDDGYLEQISSNQWGVLREIPFSTYQEILRQAGVDSTDVITEAITSVLPDIEDVSAPSINDGSLLVASVSPGRGSGGGTRGSSGRRRSNFSKIIGDRAEEIVFRYLKETLEEPSLRTLKWLAEQGITPGYDIEYTDNEGNIIGVEVKGTGGPKFHNVEVTRNEWKAAQQMRDRYVLYLVGTCTSVSPTIEIITNPYGLMRSGELEAEPLSWQLSLVVE